MKGKYADITGISKVNEFPKIPRNFPFSEICETYNFHIPKAKPNIYKILKLIIDASIKEIKIVDTPCGKKTIVEGIIHIKVFYSSDIYSTKINFVHIDIPIYTFLALKDTIDISILIEDAVIHKLDSRNISISCLLFVYPQLEEMDIDEYCDVDSHEYEKDNHEYEMDSHDYEIDNHEYKMDSHECKMDNSEYKVDSHEYDIDEKQSTDIEYCHREEVENVNFDNPEQIEFNIEYDMNSCSLGDDYWEEKKEDCNCE